ncbi:MAG: hypothetical protein LBB77_10035 [Treponema sp.]|jgi:hypothetical protein|nr:hypothetical protein [Treponema sp.]
MKQETTLFFFRTALSRWLLLFLFPLPLFSFGAKEEPAPELLDPNWTLLITAFDTSALGETNSALGETVMLNLAMEIGKLNYRLRVSEEYTYYKSLAERQNQSAAAQVLVNKRNERDQLIYKGDPQWKYRKTVKSLDEEIKKLEEDYRKILALEVFINREPVFILARENGEGLFPQPPKEGNEYQFCKNLKIDAVITGSMSEYHGRIFVTQNLYVLYADSYIYRDSIIFSPERSVEAMDEFADRITQTIAGLPPAELKVTAMPESALVLLDRGYGGRGELEQMLPPGTVRVEAFAEDHESADMELKLEGGERTELSLNLKPLELIPLNIDVPGEEGVSVYLDSLFMGKTPLTLTLPGDRLEYVFAESSDGNEAQAIFLSPPPRYLPPAVESPGRPRLFAKLFPPKNDLEGNNLKLRLGPPYDPKAERVDRARRMYYWAWAGTWVSAIGAWMLNGYANSVVNAYNNNSARPVELYNKAKRAQTLNYVGIGLVSTAVLVEIIQMARYITIAGKDSPPYVE